MKILNCSGRGKIFILVSFFLLTAMPTSAHEVSKKYEVGVAYILTKPDAPMCGYYHKETGERVPELSKIVRRKDTKITEFPDGRKIRGGIRMTDSERLCCVKGKCTYPKENLFVR